MPGDLKGSKKKQGKKTNKQTKKQKVRLLMDFVIMEHEIPAASINMSRLFKR